MLFLTALLTGCEKESTYLTGDILGYAKLIDENGYEMDDHSNINISIQHDSSIYNVQTNESGQFLVKDLVFGRYWMNPSKDGFYSPSDYQINHVGGYSPTLLKTKLYEVPKYEIYIDSVSYLDEFHTGDYSYYGFGKLSETQGLPIAFYQLQCIFGSSKSISIDEYETYWAAFIFRDEIAETVKFRITPEYTDVLQFESDSVYMRVYPTAQAFAYDPIRKDALGKPSNVISFVLEN